MGNNISIKFKAAFLLVVFALNTIVGFACAIGIDMGFNSDHHHDEEMVQQPSMHHHGPSHHHDEVSDHHDKKGGKDSCCNDGVTKLAQLDKSVPQSQSAGICPVFFATFISCYYSSDILSACRTKAYTKRFVRSCHPTIPDIRIAIQSFQI